ncbi:MAG TPA: ribosomal L7Ae/L30e/S12e/Gadd45 family protein [Capillibacterium sp.]
MNKFLNLLGMARKAGKLALGFTAVSLAVKRGRAVLVLLATDTSTYTREKMERLCRRHQVSLYYVANRYELGRALGKTSQAVVALLSPEIGEALKAQLTARTE